MAVLGASPSGPGVWGSVNSWMDCQYRSSDGGCCDAGAMAAPGLGASCVSSRS